ncbi:CarD family transcriptional regulator [uncultured Clostridium sp.]|uniref:CarD family transcriptional regulator n=1 Tax=uncultured Clostridium sp. TaxID=59620 RepID=UPI0025CC55AC|nr:CarD family transcriptional regulator [uncultured Clostridium sp.]
MIDFNIGDKIVYPNQGVGVIDFIEEKEFKGRMEKYYKIHLINNTMILSLPLSRAISANMRLISDSETLDSKLNCMKDYVKEVEKLARINYKERNEIYSTKVKSGTLEDLIEIISNLTELKTIHNLNSMEKMILRNTKKILIDEIAQSKKISIDEASCLLELCINS